jgi:DNA-binding GntR family transcriptional regulator
VSARATEASYDPLGLDVRELAKQARARYGTAQEAVIAGLREAVLRGLLPPGARLRQEELAEIFATSRIPIRDGLRALEYEGLVLSEPHRGFTVTSLDVSDIEEIYDLRILLEGHAVRMAVPLLTESDIERLEATFHEMESAEDPDAILAARERLYLDLYAVSGRRRLVSLIARLRQDVARSLRRRLVQHSPTHHREFFAAVRAGEGDRAAELLATHYRKVAAFLSRTLREPRSHGLS